MFKLFMHAARQKIGYVLSYVLLLVVTNAMLIGYPLFMNHMSSAQMNDLALGWCLYSGLIPIVLCLKDYILNVTCNLMANDIVADLIMQITQKEILAVQAYSSDTINRSLHSYAFLLCSYYLYCGLDMLVSVLSVALMLGILYKTQMILAILVALIQGVRLLALFRLASSLENKSQQRADSYHAFLGCFMHDMQKLKEILVRQKGVEAGGWLCQKAKAYLCMQKAYARVEAGMELVDRSGIFLGQLFSLGAALLLSYILPVSFSSLQLLFLYSESIGQEISGINEFMQMGAMARSYHHLVKQYTSLPDVPSARQVPSFHTLTVKDLSFAYKGQKDILEHVEMTFQKGTIHVISGENGQGKSTFAKLLTGLYPMHRGELLLDDQALSKDGRLNYLSEKVCYFAQDATLFEGTIRENLFCDDKDQIMSLKQALCLPDLDRYVHWQDPSLSGGEKRKVLLARFLIEVAQKNPSLVILDEPTAALDHQTAHWVWHQIAALSNTTVMIVITHDVIPDYFHLICDDPASKDDRFIIENHYLSHD